MERGCTINERNLYLDILKNMCTIFISSLSCMVFTFGEIYVKKIGNIYAKFRMYYKIKCYIKRIKFYVYVYIFTKCLDN